MCRNHLSPCPLSPRKKERLGRGKKERATPLIVAARVIRAACTGTTSRRFESRSAKGAACVHAARNERGHLSFFYSLPLSLSLSLSPFLSPHSFFSHPLRRASNLRPARPLILPPRVGERGVSCRFNTRRTVLHDMEKTLSFAAENVLLPDDAPPACTSASTEPARSRLSAVRSVISPGQRGFLVGLSFGRRVFRFS